MIFQKNNPNPSRKGYQKNEFLKKNFLYCCLVNIEDKKWLNKVKNEIDFKNGHITIRKGEEVIAHFKGIDFEIGTNLFFSDSEEEIYQFYSVFGYVFDSTPVYSAVFGPNSECETENT